MRTPPSATDTEQGVIRAYTPADRDAVSALLVRAFREDPAWQHTFGERVDDGLAFVLPRLLDMRHAAGAPMRIADDGSGPVGIAAATPGELSFGLAHFIRHGLLWMPLRFGLPTVRRMLAADAEVGALRRVAAPPGPHLYGAQLAIAPEHQRRGLGTRLLESWRDELDASGLPVLAITTRAENVAYYESFGFRVAAQAGIGRAFTAWAMLRPARSS